MLSASGRGAVAVVRVWGARALFLADSAFRPARGPGLSRSKAGRLRVGRIGSGLGDEVVAVVIRREPPEVEIQCHGGEAAVGLVVAALVEGGARVRDPRAWARQDAGSSIRAEAALALGPAPTLRVAEILRDQAEGALDRELREILEMADPASHVEGLIRRARVGARMGEGWRLALAGRPNVGKSRLLNALAGYDRAIVAPEPGTTRDVVTVTAAVDGWPVEIADTAGLRDTADPIESTGVALARDRHRSADLVVAVLDRSEPLTDADHAILAGHPGALVVANKSDLPPAWDEAEVGALAVSAERGDGVEALVAAIAGRLVPDPPWPGSGVPFRRIHARRLVLILDRIGKGDLDRARRSVARWLG